MSPVVRADHPAPNAVMMCSAAIYPRWRHLATLSVAVFPRVATYASEKALSFYVSLCRCTGIFRYACLTPWCCHSPQCRHPCLRKWHLLFHMCLCLGKGIFY